MTLSVSWVREFGETKELIVATDSRLRWGQAWDCCPKIMMLPRGDSVLCFAGETRVCLSIYASNTKRYHDV